MQVLLTKTGSEYLESGIHGVESRIQDCPRFPDMGRNVTVIISVGKSAKAFSLSKSRILLNLLFLLYLLHFYPKKSYICRTEMPLN